MQNTDYQKYYYLQQMGIEVWQTRAPHNIAEENYEGFILKTVDKRAVGEVWLAHKDESAEVQQKVYRLLDAMFASVGLVRESKSEDVNSQFCLVMGESLAHLFTGVTSPLSALRLQELRSKDQNQTIFVTYHPYELLLAPIKKREAWQDLQNFCKIIDIPLVKRKDALASN